MLFAAAALADGGAVRSSAPIGPLLVTVFTAPTPLRAGPIDISVMVQRRGDDSAVLDAEVSVGVRSSEDPSRRQTAAATREAATNKLLYAAPLQLAAGRWLVDVAVRAAGAGGTISFAIDVDPAPPPWVTFWPYFLLPLVLIGLYVVNQRLRASTR